MLKLRLAPFAALGLCVAIAIGQEPAADTAPAPESKPASTASKSVPVAAAKKHLRAPIHRAHKPVAVATPVATPAPKKPGFWKRVFGSKNAKPTPTPVPATPKPVVVPHTTPKPAVKPKVTTKHKTTTPKAADTGKPKDKPEVTPPTDNPTPVKTEDTPKTGTVKSSGKHKANGEKVQNFPPSPDKDGDADGQERQRYDQARAKAMGDEKLQELRTKADAAVSDDESRKALRAYNKALFKRIREIDPSVKDRADRMESAVMSRLGE